MYLFEKKYIHIYKKKIRNGTCRAAASFSDKLATRS